MKCAIILLALTSALAVPVEDAALTEFVSGNHAFSSQVYKELSKSEKGNYIFSPLSAQTILSLTNEGARGDTSAELVRGVSLPSTEEARHQTFKTFLTQLKKSDENLKLLSANKIYANAGTKLEEAFEAIAASVYNSSAENVNFVENTKAAETINSWVEEHTNSKIQKLIKPDSINGDTRLVLVNALYFSGKWTYPFETYQTSKKKFYRTKDDTVEVDTMQQIEYLNYYENKELNAKFLELPYRGADISMVIALPNEHDGLARLEGDVSRLLEPQPFTKERVDVNLPRFTIETEIAFIPILKKLGVEKVFGADADLSGLSSTDKNLYISEVIQKAFINVTEAGTEAAAATAVIMAIADFFIQETPPPPVPFIANHPFLYYITYRGVNLFTGRITEFK